MPGPPAADWNMVHHPRMLHRERVRSSRSHEEKREPLRARPHEGHLTNNPTLDVAKTPTTAVPNGRSVTWEGRTGWKKRYFNTSRDSARVGPGGNGSICLNVKISDWRKGVLFSQCAQLIKKLTNLGLIKSANSLLKCLPLHIWKSNKCVVS